MDTATTTKLSDAILAYCVSGGGSESVSFIHRNLQIDGWKGLGRLHAFETTCRQLGFTVRQGKNNRGQSRTEVTV